MEGDFRKNMVTNGLHIHNLTYLAPEAGANQRPLLQNLSLSLLPGEWITVVGMNGSGKSTLARILAGLERDIPEGAVERGFAGTGILPYVMQHPDAAIVGATPWEDIILGLEQQGVPGANINELAQAALHKVGMHGYLHTPVERLSGGYKQLLAIAGCIARPAAILILDEATSMLDQLSRQLVRKAVDAIWRSGTAIVWITQKMDEIGLPGRVIALRQGAVSFDGDAERWLLGDGENGTIPCTDHGYPVPYAAQIAGELRKRGVQLTPLPLDGRQLAKVVQAYGR